MSKDWGYLIPVLSPDRNLVQDSTRISIFIQAINKPAMLTSSPTPNMGKTILRGFSLGIGIAIFVVLLFWNMIIISNTLDALEDGGNDFARFYHASTLFLEGENMYGPNPATLASWFGTYAVHLWDLNPPHFHLLILPLTALPIFNAFIVWAFINLVVLFVTIRFITHEISPQITIRQSFLVLLGLLAFTGTGFLLRTGQISLILLLPITLAWIHARNNNWRNAGLYLGLATSLKPFFLIFFPYLLFRKKYQALPYYTIFSLSPFIVGIFIFGIESHMAWFQALGSVTWLWAGSNLSVLGLLSRLLSESPTFVPVANIPSLIFPLWMILGGTIGVLTLFAVLTDNTDHSVDRSFALLLLGALLISPLGWTYYLFFPLAPICAVVMTWRKSSMFTQGMTTSRKTRARNLIGLLSIPGLMVPLFFVGLFQPNALSTIFLGSIYFWSTFSLWASFMTDWWLGSAKKVLPFSLNSPHSELVPHLREPISW